MGHATCSFQRRTIFSLRGELTVVSRISINLEHLPSEPGEMFFSVFTVTPCTPGEPDRRWRVDSAASHRNGRRQRAAMTARLRGYRPVSTTWTKPICSSGLQHNCRFLRRCAITQSLARRARIRRWSNPVMVWCLTGVRT